MWCAAAPPVAVVAISLALLTGAGAGLHPFWRPIVLNLAEAAAARDVATLAAAIERGGDPNAAYVIRRPLLDAAAAVTATPLEAGVRTGRLEVIALLLEKGVRLEPDERRTLVCEARGRGFHDVDAYLARPLGLVACEDR
jgi:hypothetical protein